MSESEKTGIKQDRRKSLPQLFKPGQSGNPKGRPKGARQLSTILKDALRQIAKSKDGKPLLDPETNEPVTYEVALIKRVIEKAVMKGDYKTIELIFDRIEGKPRQKIDFSDETADRNSRFDDIRKIVSILTHGDEPDKKEDSGEEDM